MKNESMLRKKHIAVVSSNKSISEFLSLEAQSCGCHVDVMSRLPISFVNYDIIVIDDDGSIRIPENSNGIYIITHNDEQNGENTFHWPMRVSDIRRIYEGDAERNPVKVVNSEDDVIYLTSSEEKAVIYQNKRISLTDGEWRVISCLGNAGGKAVSREELMSLFDTADGNIAEVYICRLRRKLEAPFGVRFIRTVRGKGYSLNVRISKSK